MIILLRDRDGPVVFNRTGHVLIPTEMSQIGQNLPHVDLIFLSAGNAENAQKGIKILRDTGITPLLVEKSKPSKGISLRPSCRRPF